jgi:hypothetical protein
LDEGQSQEQGNQAWAEMGVDAQHILIKTQTAEAQVTSAVSHSI